ncbi:MAG TPA: hypothetical protein VH331_09930 [Allosphingosinicella sp.]|nr:hypothetical protein [Allosphingosinicella sp.]
MRTLATSALILIALWASGGAHAAAAGVISSIDLSKPFDTRSTWRFTASQSPEIDDPLWAQGGKVPGSVHLCISNDEGKSCRPDLRGIIGTPDANNLFWEPHYFNGARIVRPHGGRALLLVQAASLNSGDGDQAVATEVLAYDRRRDRFVPVYRETTGRNNNEEVRYMAGGPLEGAVISAEPTERAPFGFWVTVHRLTPAYIYRQVLRYRSATHYGDGNPLAVIDSEMPNIARRLGLWRPGSPPPLPKERCPRPHLIRMELWCK